MSATGGKVIVAVHDPDVRDVVEQALRGAGHVLIVARSVSEALDASASANLIVADFELPDDGARRICASGAGVPVLVLVPRAGHEEIERGLALGADDIIARPFFAPELAARAAVLVRLHKLQASSEEERRQFDVLMDITRTVSSRTEPEQILNELVAQLSEYLNVERATIILVSRDPHWGYAVASSDPAGKPGLQIDLRKYPEVQRTLASRKVLIIEDVSTSRVLAPLKEKLLKAGIASLLALPIAPEGEPAATLLLHTRGTRRKFTRQEIKLCAAAAEAAGMALRNARLFRAVRG